jgi:hypothetical protein
MRAGRRRFANRWIGRFMVLGGCFRGLDRVGGIDPSVWGGRMGEIR